MLRIESNTNPKIKQLIKLRDRRERNKTALFTIEGYREIFRAEVGNVVFKQLYICEELFLGENEPALIEKIKKQGAQIFALPKFLFEKVSYRDRPDGLIGVADQMGKSLADFKLSDNPFFVLAESIEKPGNLGTIMRSSDAAGTDGVIVCDRCTDIYNPNVVRASVGTLFTQDVIEAQSEETLAYLKKNGVKIVAATPSATESFTDCDLSGPIAIAVGTEQLGLTDFWMKNADIQVSIPMNGVADSLNVATATTLLLYEVVRQRGL